MANINLNDKLKNASEDLTLTMAGELKKKKVLIADPHSTSRNSMQMVLSKIDITNVTSVSSTKEVIKAVKKDTYDIIISEYYLSDDRNGQQLLEELRYAKIIPLTTAYVIITSENQPTNVVSLAELVPDGLAFFLKGQGRIDEAQKLAEELVEEHINFIALYDFLANIYTEKCDFINAQRILEKCHEISPHNLERQRLFGNIALKNGDVETAQKIFGIVLKQSKDSSLRTAEDFSNLAEINLKKGDIKSSAALLLTIKKEQKSVIKNKIDELEFLIVEAFCLISGNEHAQLHAKDLIKKALKDLKELQNSETEKQNLNARIYTHLAVVCNKAGMVGEAGRLIIQANKLKQASAAETAETK